MSSTVNDVVYESVALHEHREFQQGCVSVLQEEWSRSSTARDSMLEKSNEKFPYCIVLIMKTCDDAVNNSACTEVIGHSRLCRVHGKPNAAFVESVVVRKSLRGRGLGRKLMVETEKHASRFYSVVSGSAIGPSYSECAQRGEQLGVTTLYLTTHDKQDFYQHIGYELCQPVVSFGSASSLLSDDKFARLIGKMDCSSAQVGTPGANGIQSPCGVAATSPLRDDSWHGDVSQSTDDSVALRKTEELKCTTIDSKSPPPPPPPHGTSPPPPLPPPPPPVLLNANIAGPCCSIWMKKELCAHTE